MKENSPQHSQEGASLEGNESMPGMAPPVLSLTASSISNSSLAPGATTMQLQLDPQAPMQLAQLREDYPWQGIVDAAAGTLLMREWGMCKMDDPMLASGTRLTVIAGREDYLQVNVGGDSGWVEKDNVDDVVSNHIENNMVGDQMDWGPSGANGNTDFAQAARDPALPMPDGSDSSFLNCWEMILLAAFQVGMLSRATIQDLYQNDRLEDMMTTSGTYTIGDPDSPTPARGDIMFMNGLAHVVIAQGERDAAGNLKVWSFWPPSDFSADDLNAAVAAGEGIGAFTTGIVQDTTIEALSGWMAGIDFTDINPNPITFGTPIW